MNINDIDTSNVTDEMLNEYLAKENKALNDFWAAEKTMQRLDRLRNQIENNTDFKAVYESALANFRQTQAVAKSFGLFL